MIDRKKIRLRYELASGQFGEVYKGTKFAIELLTTWSHELTILESHKYFNKLGQVSFVEKKNKIFFHCLKTL
jgi:hypothetical protein